MLDVTKSLTNQEKNTPIDKNENAAKNVEFYWLEFLEATDQKIAAQQELINSFKKELETLKKNHRYSLNFKFDKEGLVTGLLRGLYQNIHSWQKLQACKARVREAVNEHTARLNAMKAFRQTILGDPYSFARWLNTHHRAKGEQTFDRAKNVFREFTSTQLLLT